MKATAFVRFAVGICAVVLACEMSACGRVASTTLPVEDDARSPGAADASDGTAADASADAGASPESAWHEDPSTLHPDRANCLDRPVGTCDGIDFFTAADEKCNPAETCSYLGYAIDENGCLAALAAPAGGDPQLQECIAGEIARKRWPCAANRDSLAYLGPCLIR